MSGRRPKARMEYKAKDGTRYEIAAVWGGKIDWADNVSPQKEDVTHDKYPKMRMSDAVKRVEAGDGFLNLVYPKQDRPDPVREAKRNHEAGYTDAEAGGVGDDDIPFDRIRGEWT